MSSPSSERRWSRLRRPQGDDVSELQRVAIGDTAPGRNFGPISRTDIVRYQGASGDFNPIHHDDEFAQSAGYPTVFSVGMLQAGFLATYVSDWFGPAQVRRFAVQFKEQV